MSKENRMMQKIVAGVIGIGGVGVYMHEGEEPRTFEKSVETSDVNVENVSKNEEQKEIEAKKKYAVEHPIETELAEQHVSSERILRAQSEAAALIRSERFRDKKNEAKYFSACSDETDWQPILKSIQFASEKTGVPERILISMGFIESQFDVKAKRDDTHVYGAFQMDLATAKEAAKDAVECFGLPVDVTSADVLEEMDTSVRLAALYLRSLKKKYGSYGLAMMRYASKQRVFEQHIQEAFPSVDFGSKDWKEMEKQHAAEEQFQKLRDELLKRMNQGRATEHDRHVLKQVYRQFEAAGLAYKQAKKIWSKKQNTLATVLQEKGVHVVSLYEHQKKKKGSIAESLKYALVIDSLSTLAAKYEKQPVLKEESHMVK